MKLATKTTMAAAVLLLLMVLSCSDRGSNDDRAPVQVGMLYQSPTIAEHLNLAETVILRVSAQDMDEIIETVPVVEGRAEISLDVPPGEDRLFEMSVLDQGERVIYYGSEVVTITQGLDQQVDILLEPVVLLLRPSPLYQEVAVGSKGSVDIYVFEVDSLFGGAFRFIYEPASVRIDSVKAGEFLGLPGEILFHTHSEDNEMGISIVRLEPVTGSIGVSGSGVLAKVYFTVLVQGQNVLDLGISSQGALQRSNGAPVERIEELYLDDAIVVGRAVQ